MKLSGEWRPIKSMRGGKGTKFGSIGRDGRLLLPFLISNAADLTPGQFVELYVREVVSGWQIAVVPVKVETAWSVRVGCTGKKSDYTERTKDKHGRIPSLTVSLQTALRSLSITITKRLRVPVEWNASEGALIVSLGDSPTTAAHLVRTEDG